MRLALMADLHANRQAFEACLGHAASEGVDRHVFLGDYVGYGADPVWVMEVLMDAARRGAVAVLGNHDRAVAEEDGTQGLEADLAMAWTRGQLGPEPRRFLRGLPLRAEEEDRLFVHATPEPSARWPYLDGPEAALRALGTCASRTVFCGHVHVAALYGRGAAGQAVAFSPVPGVPIPLSRPRRWLAVLPSVGQPRDGHPAAGYALLDTARQEFTCFRVPYDVEGACRAIRAAGLPEGLALRLQRGR